MLLTREQLKACATGWLETREDNEGIVFFRMPEELHRRYVKRDEVLAGRSLASASVVLEFWTDARSLTVEYDGQRAECGPFMPLDFYCDGILCPVTGFDREKNTLTEDCMECCALTANLPEGEHLVSVYLPWNLTARIHTVTLEGETFRPHRRKLRWLAMGDSITQGVKAEHASMTYVNRLARKLDAEVLNVGIGGDTFCDCGVLPYEYPKVDFVTSAYGTNDFNHRKEAEFAHHMPLHMQHLAEAFPSTPIFVLLPLWRGLEAKAPVRELISLQCVRERIAKEAAKYPNMTVIDCRHFLPHEQEYYGDPYLLHPNDAGFDLYAEKLYEILKETL